MSTSSEPRSLGHGDGRGAARERPGARPVRQGATPPADHARDHHARDHHGRDHDPSHDQGEVVAAALVRVAAPGPADRPGPAGRGGARLGVMLQTVSAVSWLSAGRARGAA